MGVRMRMSTGQPRMTIDAKLLILTQWLSPGYPVGAFTWSHGLEAAIRAGWIGDACGLQNWLRDILEHGSGRADAIWITLAYHAQDATALEQIDASARAFAPARERLREAERQGAAFIRVTHGVWKIDIAESLLPVALGQAARALDLPLESVIALYLQSFAGNLVSAAQRLMPLGQTEAQSALSALAPLCLAVARSVRHATADDICSNAFLSDIAAINHETLEPRLFQS